MNYNTVMIARKPFPLRVSSVNVSKSAGSCTIIQVDKKKVINEKIFVVEHILKPLMGLFFALVNLSDRFSIV